MGWTPSRGVSEGLDVVGADPVATGLLMAQCPRGEGRPGGAFASDDLPDPPDRCFIRPDNPARVARHGTTTWTLHRHAPEVSKITSGFWPGNRVGCRKVLAGRKPLVFSRFDGAFLLRFAARTFAAWFVNVPPRRRREFG